MTATGNQAYCAKSQIKIVTDFDIVDPDDTSILALYVQISAGYVLGEDTLSLIGNHPNIAPPIWNSLEGKLTLEGVASAPVSYIDIIAAVKDIVFQSTSNNPSDKSFSITIGDANFLPSTGHYYEYVPAVGITWTNAKTAAELRIYYGLQGYLATLTSAEEAQLCGEQAAGAGWIGGSDAETEGTWKWVTGPESGTIFWYGLANGYSPNFSFWNNGEPNQTGDEDYAHITAPGVGIPGSWNDLRNTGEADGNFQPKGYIVEYGGMPGDNPLNIAASTTIYVPTIANTYPNSRCGVGSLNLAADVSVPTATVYWFDALTGGNLIGTGLTYTTPILTLTTTYYALASENGCTDGTRTPIVATIYQVPIIQSNITFKNCDDDSVPDGIANFNLNEANDIITNNASSGLTITYYMSLSDANLGVNALNASLYNNSNGNTVYARVENVNACFMVCTVNLQVSTTSFPIGFFQELDSCDDDNVIDGLTEFDLSQASSMFISQLSSGQNLSVHYYKNLSDAQLEQNEILNQTTYTNGVAFSETLYVRVESDDNGDCYGIGPHLLLTVHPRPEFEVEQTEVYCSDNIPITLEAINASGNFTYEWKDDSGQVISNLPIASVASGNSYTVTATSASGCESFPISYTVKESAMASIDLDDITIIELSDNNGISINNSNNNLGIGDYEFALDRIDGPYQNEAVFSGVAAGMHTVYIRDKNLCGIAQIDVFILGFPKFFTPNNDGKNDTWHVMGLGSEFTNASVVNIFDRYGKLIKQINAKNGVWDGTFNSEPLADSDYWFLAELVEATGNIRTYKGHFSLVR
ncbi:T9SS type B sorting domain-containing protein [Mariniflexile aquimaris]|uniref:T9SS type B sorting domain-containing protein n=1 Tax=Mariniflexile aquimaris TaxID=881009 RepID=A0ABW3BS89_9FLAO